MEKNSNSARKGFYNRSTTETQRAICRVGPRRPGQPPFLGKSPENQDFRIITCQLFVQFSQTGPIFCTLSLLEKVQTF